MKQDKISRKSQQITHFTDYQTIFLKTVLFCVLITLSTSLFALDPKYEPIVNAAITDLKTKTKLSLLQGHVTIHITSGSEELNKQFGESIQKAYPNFTYKEDTVWKEDLYQMIVKVYREKNEVFVQTVITNSAQENIGERTIKTEKVSTAVLETLQYKTAIAAKNEFEAYLDSVFGNAGAVVQDAQLLPPKPPLSDAASHLWTVGASLGSSFAPPWVIATARVTLAFATHLFTELGCDFGFVSGVEDVKYYSLYPFVHYAFFLPFSEESGWYIGGGGAWFYANYKFPEGDVPVSTFALDVITGFHLWDFFDFSYTLRTNFSGVSHKASIGVAYKFFKGVL